MKFAPHQLGWKSTCKYFDYNNIEILKSYIAHVSNKVLKALSLYKLSER